MTASRVVIYDARIARAVELAASHPQAAELLSFYAELARFQKQINGDDLVSYFPALIDLVGRKGTKLLSDYGREHLTTTEAQTSLLTSCWNNPNAEDIDPPARFYARVLLQPWAEGVAGRTSVPTDGAPPTCPVCNAKPLAGVLRGEGDGAKRWLLCSLCSTEWTFRRVLCPSCGEENKDMLPVYTAPEIPTARIDACDKCGTYIKSVDLTKDGHAIPVVDDIATVSLDIWAEEHSYVRLQRNLLGI